MARLEQSGRRDGHGSIARTTITHRILVVSTLIRTTMIYQILGNPTLLKVRPRPKRRCRRILTKPVTGAIPEKTTEGLSGTTDRTSLDMKMTLTGLFIVVAVATSLFGATSNELVKTDGILDLSGLTGKDKVERLAAYRLLVQNREQLSAQLNADIKAMMGVPDASYEGGLHLAIRVAGEYRIETVVPELISHIDYRLDLSTFPSFRGRLTASALYPAAEALVRIGGKQLPELLVQRIRQNENEDTKRACAWVLNEYLGKELATQLLEQAIDRESDDLTRNRLSSALKLLGLEDPILKYKQ